ncbi:MAG: hypothetical protein LC808_37195 [Actinobacteria bacterium]|nr:hypothetical protein [Actinomycetota bacterium]
MRRAAVMGNLALGGRQQREPRADARFSDSVLDGLTEIGKGLSVRRVSGKRDEA